MKPSKNGKFSSRRIIFWVLNAVLVFLITVAFVRGLSLLRAASVIYGFSPHRTPFIVRAYSKMFRHDVAVTDISIPGRHGSVAVRMVFPRDCPNAPMVVLVHGLAPQGNRDNLLNIYASHLAQIGLRVALPNITSEQHRLMRADALDQIVAAIRWSTAISRQRVALFGISFGGGLAIAAADMPQYSGLLKMVFSDAGYNSIDRLGRYYIGDPVSAPDGRPYKETPPKSGPLLMAFQHLDEMIPEKDVSMFHALILDRTLNRSDSPMPVTMLDPAQSILYQDLRAVHSAGIREKYRNLLDAHRAEMAAISPHNHMQGLEAPLYILHGSGDNSIPPEETEWTVKETPSQVKVHVLITPWMSHAVLLGHVSLKDKIRIGDFVCQVLAAALKPSPL